MAPLFPLLACDLRMSGPLGAGLVLMRCSHIATEAFPAVISKSRGVWLPPRRCSRPAQDERQGCLPDRRGPQDLSHPEVVTRTSHHPFQTIYHHHKPTHPLTHSPQPTGIKKHMLRHPPRARTLQPHRRLRAGPLPAPLRRALPSRGRPPRRRGAAPGRLGSRPRAPRPPAA